MLNLRKKDPNAFKSRVNYPQLNTLEQHDDKPPRTSFHIVDTSLNMNPHIPLPFHIPLSLSVSLSCPPSRFLTPPPLPVFSFPFHTHTHVHNQRRRFLRLPMARRTYFVYLMSQQVLRQDALCSSIFFPAWGEVIRQAGTCFDACIINVV